MKFKLYSPNAAKVSEIEVADFPVVEANKGVQALKQYLVSYRANQRQGNASTQNRGDQTNYSGKKIYAQKGTGRSRHGDKTSPIFYHGAVAFGPKPRSYNKKLNEPTKRLAFRRALAEKAPAISLIERFEAEKPSTKTFNAVVGKIAPKGKVLVVDDSFGSPVLLSARNIERVALCDAAQVNAFDLIRYSAIVVSQKGLEKILSRVK